MWADVIRCEFEVLCLDLQFDLCFGLGDFACEVVCSCDLFTYWCMVGVVVCYCFVWWVSVGLCVVLVLFELGNWVWWLGCQWWLLRLLGFLICFEVFFGF